MIECNIKILGAQFAANPDYKFGDPETDETTDPGTSESGTDQGETPSGDQTVSPASVADADSRVYGVF